MKLTFAQIITLRDAAALYAEKAKYRAFPGGTHWQAEAAIADDLVTLLSGADNVEIEGVNLEPSKDACGDIGGDGQCPVEVRKPRRRAADRAAETSLSLSRVQHQAA